MATLPESAGFGTELVLASQPSLTWLIDKEQNQVSRMDEGLEAVRQAVEIALSVERFRWQIYSTNFGAELDDLIGEDEAYIVSELPRLIDAERSNAIYRSFRLPKLILIPSGRNIYSAIFCCSKTLPTGLRSKIPEKSI